MWSVVDSDITTIESVALEPSGELNRLAQCFVDEQAAQCGYCISGIILSVHSFIENNIEVDESALLEYITERNLCRCGTHVRIVRAIRNYLNTALKAHSEPSYVVAE
jgi:nicotinate dehydrogenase subunit A